MKKKVAIIGGGSAGVLSASFIDRDKYEVSIYEKTSRTGRKFLVAGHGGLNLSQDMSRDLMKQKYRPSGFMDVYLDKFDAQSCQQYFERLGVQTFTGTSGKIFPIDLKPAQVWQSILDSISDVNIVANASFQGFKDETPVVNGNIIEADYYVFALGGASWKKTGSDGKWTDYFKEIDINIESFKPSNCGWLIDWSEEVKNTLAFKPLKNVVIHVENQSISGEAMITDYGIEGGVIYRSNYTVKGFLNNSPASAFIDLKPTLSEAELTDLLSNRKKSIKSTLKNVLKLEENKITLLMLTTTKEQFSDSATLASLIKNYPLHINGLSPIDEAISTTGGINLLELDSNLSLYKYPHFYCVGEMIDYDTTTGGYLLQSCMSMAYSVAETLNNKL